MKSIKSICLVLAAASILLLGGCSDDNGSIIDQVTGLTPQNDVELGRSVVDQIEADPTEYPMLSRSEYPEAYAYLDAMRAELLTSDDINHKDIFPYTFTIIERDDVLNAFATPGGFMYVYTGLIKYLDRADDLAGVLGHEIAHASERHSSDQLKQQLGVQFLISIALGESSASQIAQLGANFLSLSFSRADENEADEYSVMYLADTGYACNGTAGFFSKLQDEGQCSGNFAFLSTHPDPCNRVADIDAKAEELGCSSDAIVESGMSYQDFISSLP